MGKKIGAKKKLKKLEKNGCEKDAASELLFGLLGVNRLKWPEMELIFFNRVQNFQSSGVSIRLLEKKKFI